MIELTTFFNANRFVHIRNTIFANSTTGGNCAGAHVQLHGTYNLDDGGTCGFKGVGCAGHGGKYS